jgi:transcriptional regulator with XRE-family HTH domain
MKNKSNTTDACKAFGLTLRDLRARDGLSLRDLEDKSGVPNPIVSAMEHGRRHCAPQVAKKLADVFFTRPVDENERREFLYAAARTAPSPGVIEESRGFPPIVLDSVAHALRQQGISAQDIIEALQGEGSQKGDRKPDLVIRLRDGRTMVFEMKLSERKT